MSRFSRKVKNKLLRIISDMDKTPWMFAKNPKVDFSRKSPLSLKTMLNFLISMEGQPIHQELYEFFKFKIDTPSASAFVQRRSKIDISAFNYLFHKFNASFKSTRMMNGYKLLAVDGSDLHTPTNSSDASSYFKSSDTAKGYNLFHLNALYNLLDKRYEDVILQPRRKFNEHRALCDMVDKSNIGSKVIILADRGYEGYNTIAHIEQKGWNYLIRIKDKTGIAAQLTLPESDEFDVNVDLTLSRRQSKEMKSQPDKYRSIMPNMIFDYLPKKSKETYQMKFRIIRVKISDNVTETLVTNLPEETFSPTAIKRLYNMRWGIETSFRELKYNVGLVNFHSKKADFIIQEVYARLIMYNLSMIITRNVCIQQDDRAYKYQINYAMAIFICKYFMKNKESPPNAEALIAKNLLPIRPNRKYNKNIRYKTSVSFIYRVA